MCCATPLLYGRTTFHSFCPAVRLSAAGKGVLAVAYNPLAWSREVLLRVPLNTSKTCAWKVTGGCGRGKQWRVNITGGMLPWVGLALYSVCSCC